jgi:RNA ligase (TIGR02306 family)
MALASIQKIHSIAPHPDPEVTRLQVAKIFEWPVVVEKDKHREGDLVVFIEIDSIVPERPEFEFMRSRKFRIYNAKFKNAPSSGLVMPLSILPEGDWKEGDDVVEALGVRKYERPVDPQMGGDAEGDFPRQLISISDETNLLGCRQGTLDELEGREIFTSTKNDGSSTTFIYNKGEFQACSRRLLMKEGSGFPWQAAAKYELKERMAALGRNLAIQAECCGPKLNGNQMELKEMTLFLFRAKCLDTRQVLGLDEMVQVANALGVPHVKIIDRFVFDKSIHTAEYFRSVADAQVWDTNGKPAEGIVVAPVATFFSPKLQKDWSVKIINQIYK